MATQIFGAPGRYIQGAGAAFSLGGYIKPLGERVLVSGGRTGLLATREGRGRSFQASGIRQVEEPFRGETCDSEIERLCGIAKAHGCDVILASGGGKVIDTVKAVAELLGVPSVIVPTTAASDAPCSALAVIYNEDGSFNRLMPLKKSPALVIVDTEIIANAPVRQLVSGMGDAIATWFEAEAAYKSGALNNFGGNISMAAIALSKLCRDTLLEYGREAVRSAESKTVTMALEKVVEANTLLSGLGFESGGVAVAHALSESFTIIPAMHDYTHGEKVALGLLVHMRLEGRSEGEIREIKSFCEDIGLPVALPDSVDEDLMRAVAQDAAALGKPSHNLWVSIMAEEILEAMRGILL
ncbi:MAG: glycerol dehydrogenase [Oscillospiraceae bacterium]|nr:glycerol dehydrogenase [Oscillospiraceae bacterium]